MLGGALSGYVTGSDKTETSTAEAESSERLRGAQQQNCSNWGGEGDGEEAEAVRALEQLRGGDGPRTLTRTSPADTHNTARDVRSGARQADFERVAGTGGQYGAGRDVAEESGAPRVEPRVEPPVPRPAPISFRSALAPPPTARGGGRGVELGTVGSLEDTSQIRLASASASERHPLPPLNQPPPPPLQPPLPPMSDAAQRDGVGTLPRPPLTAASTRSAPPPR